jgi:hypothetical protein
MDNVDIATLEIMVSSPSDARAHGEDSPRADRGTTFGQMLVTPKVRRVFLAAGVTSFDWLPIHVEETEGASRGGEAR